MICCTKRGEVKNKMIWVLAIIGAVAAVTRSTHAVYRFFTGLFGESLEDDFDDKLR